MRNHGFLRNFYDSYLPYTEEFEQMYNIIEEEFGQQTTRLRSVIHLKHSKAIKKRHKMIQKKFTGETSRYNHLFWGYNMKSPMMSSITCRSMNNKKSWPK